MYCYAGTMYELTFVSAMYREASRFISLLKFDIQVAVSNI